MITSFSGKHQFLSNFYPCTFYVYGVETPSAEHVYQAMKATNKEDFDQIMSVASASEAKKLGGRIAIRSDWSAIKLEVMSKIVFEKFSQNEDLLNSLYETRPEELVEGNWWGDRYWGQSPVGTGRNELGKILMRIRDNSLVSFFGN
jgi:ribA/ribD-fused uncharacterized protein